MQSFRQTYLQFSVAIILTFLSGLYGGILINSVLWKVWAIENEVAHYDSSTGEIIYYDKNDLLIRKLYPYDLEPFTPKYNGVF